MTTNTTDVEADVLDKFVSITISNYESIIHVLESLTEEQVNKQIYPNKRTIAEISYHIIQAEQLPIRIHRFIDFIFGNNPNVSLGKQLDASDYTWDISKGKKHKAKNFKRDKLIITLKKIQQKRVFQYQHLNPKLIKFAHQYVRHVSTHRKQIQVLASKIHDA